MKVKDLIKELIKENLDNEVVIQNKYWLDDIKDITSGKRGDGVKFTIIVSEFDEE